MINDARIAVGKSPIGFINPLVGLSICKRTWTLLTFDQQIYASNFTDGFNDITNGTNPGCGTPGYSTSVGWDPVTGLGTPNFPKLLAKWLSLP